MTFTGTLLPYQVDAVEAMVEKKKMLVAYDLGLGKTVLTIAAIEALKDQEKIVGPGIVICLSSLKYQWAEQIRKFTNGSSNPLVIDGTPKQRQAQYIEALDWGHSLVDYVIINYEQVVNDWDYIQQLSTEFIICDEATAIKSFKSKRSKAVKKLKSPVRFALTGTPVENGKPEELYSIMQFVDSKVLGRFDLFDQTFIVRNRFGGVEKYRNLSTLNKALSGSCVRKKQSDPDVAPYLPDSIFAEPILVQFDRAGAVLYKSIVNDLLTDLDEALESYGASFNIFSHYGQQEDEGAQAVKGKIMSKLTTLRMLCDHPDLVKMSVNTSGYAESLDNDNRLDKLSASPKLSALKEFVSNFLSEYDGNKVVIFTSYVNMVDLIREEISYESRPYTGAMNAKDKEAAKVAFQTDPSIRILVSSDAGGYGVDLPQANLLINYDLPWNAGLALQRNGRIRRASSTWPSIVIQDFLMEGSVEERQHAMLQQKMAIANAIVDGEGINLEGGIDLTVGTLRSFLGNFTV